MNLSVYSKCHKLLRILKFPCVVSVLMIGKFCGRPRKELHCVRFVVVKMGTWWSVISVA